MSAQGYIICGPDGMTQGWGGFWAVTLNANQRTATSTLATTPVFKYICSVSFDPYPFVVTPTSGGLGRGKDHPRPWR